MLASLASFEKHAMADAPGVAVCKERYTSPMVIVRLFEVSASRSTFAWLQIAIYQNSEAHAQPW